MLAYHQSMATVIVVVVALVNYLPTFMNIIYVCFQPHHDYHSLPYGSESSSALEPRPSRGT